MEITSERLRSLFRPERIALVGASDKSGFSRALFANLQKYGWLERSVLVNRRSPITHGRPTVASCVDIDEPVDVAFLMVPQAGTLEALMDAREAGIRNAIVLSSGYGETGRDGQRAEAELVAYARELDMVLLGPNMMGFANFVDGIPATCVPLGFVPAGNVGLIAQSGASSTAMSDFGRMTGVGLSYMVTVGNEAMINAGHVLDFLVQDQSTEAIAMFIETISDAEVFRAAALRAAAEGKPVVALKVGRSELAARTAAAHTGAIVGDDRIIDAVLRDLGVIRVDTIEDMMITAGAAAHLGRMELPGVGFVSISGGACDMVADLAENLGLPLPALTDETSDSVRQFAASFGTVQNPLDVTGAALLEPTIFSRSIEAVAGDPGIGAVAVIYSIPWQPPAEPGTPWNGAAAAAAIGNGLARAKVPSVVVNQVVQPNSDYTMELMGDAEIPYVLPGIRSAVFALSRIGKWSQQLDAIQADTAYELSHVPVPAKAQRRGRWSETAARELLAAAGVPVVPATVVVSPEDAVAAAQACAGPVAMKIVSANILHKSDIGGVRLGVYGDVDVRTAYADIRAAAENVAGAQIDGVLVVPMRRPATELLVGVVRDPQWGPVLAVAIGGVFVEVLDDAMLTLLPASPAAVRRLLLGLRGAALLQGIRGQPPADIDALARVIARIGDLAVALEDDLLSLEINPLRVDGSTIEALDAVVEWTDSR